MPSLNERPSPNLPVAVAAAVWAAFALVSAKAAAESTAADEALPPPPELALEPAHPSTSPKVVSAQPPPPPPRRREPLEPGASAGLPAKASSGAAAVPVPGGFVHDGFYLRVGLGGGYGKTSVQTDRLSQPDVTLDGFGAAFDVWLGWTLAPGLVLGGALSFSSQRSASASIGADKSSGVASHALLGAFVDAFPNPRQGQHFGGMLALASLTETTGQGLAATDYEGAGLGLAVFAGYDAWIAREWSLGVLLRVGGVATRATQTIDQQSVEKQGTAYGASLLVTIVYH